MMSFKSLIESLSIAGPRCLDESFQVMPGDDDAKGVETRLDRNMSGPSDTKFDTADNQPIPPSKNWALMAQERMDHDSFGEVDMTHQPRRRLETYVDEDLVDMLERIEREIAQDFQEESDPIAVCLGSAPHHRPKLVTADAR